MKREDINPGDVLVSVDRWGAGYYRVIAVHKVLVKVEREDGEIMRAYPHFFDRKVPEDRMPVCFSEDEKRQIDEAGMDQISCSLP